MTADWDSATPALEGSGVVVRFGGVTAVDHVDIQLRDGMILGLIGPNGAGKTTLFDALSGVVRVTGGRISLRGQDVTRSSIVVRARRGIRRTFQRQQTFGWLTVEENLLAALEWRGGGGGIVGDLVRWPGRAKLEVARRARVAEVLELCGLAASREQSVARLSIGQARLVEIGRAIVDEPSVLLLDEPTSGLQEAEVERVGALVRRISTETGCAVGLVEHDVGFVLGLSDRVVVLNLGTILEEGTPEDIGRSKAVAEAYLGS